MPASKLRYTKLIPETRGDKKLCCNLSTSLVIYLNIKSYQFALREFVKEAGRGGKGNLPLEGTPAIVKTEAWDGKDGEIAEEDEFSLEELMGEDASSNDEL